MSQQMVCGMIGMKWIVLAIRNVFKKVFTQNKFLFKEIFELEGFVNKQECLDLAVGKPANFF